MPLIRLSPDQIMRFWPDIAQCIDSALPVHLQGDSAAMLEIQSHLLTEVLQCWVAAGDHHGSRIYGIMTTRIAVDEVAGTKNLLIYSVAVIDEHPPSMWNEAKRIISIFAKARGCQGILAYSDNPQMIAVAEKIGFNSATRLLYLEL